jgi:hypothetical protein
MFQATNSTDSSLSSLGNAPNQPPLDKGGVISSVKAEVKDKCLVFQRKYSPSKSQRLCGLSALPTRDDVVLNVYETGSASWTGTTTCGSPTCVECFAASRREHTELIQRTLTKAVELGSEVRFLTFTTSKTSLPKQIRLLRDAWKRTKAKLDRDFGKVNLKYSLNKAFDITLNKEDRFYGHIHIHCLLTFKPETPEHNHNAIHSILTNLKSYWCESIIKFGGRALLSAQDVTIVTSTDALPRYLTKEVSFGAGKDRGLLSTIASIEEEVSNGDTSGINFYRRFIRALSGLRWFSHNKHARSLAEGVLLDVDEQEPIYELRLPVKCYQGLQEAGLGNRVKQRVSQLVFSTSQKDYEQLQSLELSLFLLSEWRIDAPSIEEWSKYWLKWWKSQVDKVPLKYKV